MTLPVLGVTGYSGSGKTTLLETVISELISEGLRVGVVKHSAHHRLDEGSKDSDRFLRAGACRVTVHSGDTVIDHSAGIRELDDALRMFPPETDVVLVEGYKRAPIPKVWMAGPSHAGPPVDSEFIKVLGWKQSENPALLVTLIREEMRNVSSARKILCGILAGGRSRRMGTPKPLLRYNGKTYFELVYEAARPYADRVFGLGRGEYPGTGLSGVLPDPPGLKGPLAGILAAGRWAPDCCWLICGADMPRIRAEAVNWVLHQREPGYWAVIPKIPGGRGIDPLLACYEPMIFPTLETRAAVGNLSLQSLAESPKVKTPQVPEDLIGAFTNVNTPEEAAALPVSSGQEYTARPAPLQLDSRLETLQKMSILEDLIPGFIHAVNNDLTTISCSERVLDSLYPEDAELKVHALSIREALTRVVEAGRTVLSFCQDSQGTSVLDFVDRARKAVTLLRYIVGQRIQVTMAKGEETIPVRGNPEALLYALLLAGRQAAGAVPDGAELTFSAQVSRKERGGKVLGCISLTSSRVNLAAELVSEEEGYEPGIEPGLNLAREIVEVYGGWLTVTEFSSGGGQMSVCIPTVEF